MNNLPPSYSRSITRLLKQEERLLRRRSPAPFAPQTEKLRARIPQTLRTTLERAFEKGFSLLFGPGGTRFLDVTYAKAKLEQQAEVWESPLSAREARKALAALERGSGMDSALSSAAAGAEGMVLGLLGVGLPDIPVLLAWMLRSLYQSAARYGFSCDTPAERFYLLLLLQGALSEGDARRTLSERADRFGRALDHGWAVSFDLDGAVIRTAALLSDRLLLTKFIQGLPVVGVLGGAANFPLSSAVNQYGALKYKKRFLEKKIRGV